MPVALPIIAVALTVVGTGVGVYSSIAAGNARKKQEEYNAAIAENASRATFQQSNYEVDRVRERARRLRASQVAQASKAGIELSGSFDDIMFDSGVQEELEVMTAFYKGQLGSNTFKAQSEAATKRGEAAQSQGLLTGIGTGLSGLGSAAAIGASGFNRKTPDTPDTPATTAPGFGD